MCDICVCDDFKKENRGNGQWKTEEKNERRDRERDKRETRERPKKRERHTDGERKRESSIVSEGLKSQREREREENYLC